MKRKTKGIIIGIVILLIILSSFPNITSKSISQNKQINNENNNELPEGIIEVDVGSMYIEGTGDHNTSDVYAFAEDYLGINVGLKGSDVVFSAYYYMNCPGLWDGGYVKLSVEGAPDAEADTYGTAEGHLFATIFNCKPGKVISWTLTVAYNDKFFPYPLIEVRGGFGVCILSRPFFKNIMSLFRPLAILRGIIICR